MIYSIVSLLSALTCPFATRTSPLHTSALLHAKASAIAYPRSTHWQVVSDQSGSIAGDTTLPPSTVTCTTLSSTNVHSSMADTSTSVAFNPTDQSDHTSGATPRVPLMAIVIAVILLVAIIAIPIVVVTLKKTRKRSDQQDLAAPWTTLEAYANSTGRYVRTNSHLIAECDTPHSRND